MKSPLLLPLILLAACALRLYHLDTQSLWFDEAWSAYAAAQPTLIAAANADATNPPLYYVLLNAYARFAGASEFALRWFSLAWGMITLALIYRLAARLFDHHAGVYAMLVAAFSAPLWWASQEARMYTFLAALITLAALAWHKIIAFPLRRDGSSISHNDPRNGVRKPPLYRRAVDGFALKNVRSAVMERGLGGEVAGRVSAWLLLLAAELALLYTHNSAPVAVLWLNAITLLAWGVARSLRRPDWRGWFAGQIAVFLLWSPYLFTRFLAVGGAEGVLIRRPQLSLDLLAQIWGSYWTAPWALVGRETLLVAGSVAVLILAVLVIAWRSAIAGWLVIHVTLLTGLLLIALSALGNELHGRYLVMIAPLLVTLIGAGVGGLRWPVARLGAILLIAALGLANIHYAQNPLYGHDDARAMATYYAETLDENDSVLMWSYADRYELAYYWGRVGVRARRVVLPEGADADLIAPLLPREGDVALNVWFTQRADYRGMLDCWLSHGTRAEPQIFTTWGMENRLYTDPTFDLLSADQPLADLSIGQVRAPRALPPLEVDQALCIPVQITLAGATQGELKAAVSVETAEGFVLTRDDAVFADASQRTSLEAPSGTVLTAYPLVRLPVGTPQGDYITRLVIYDDAGRYNADLPLSVGAWNAQEADWSDTTRALYVLPVSVEIPQDNVTLIGHSGDASARNGDALTVVMLWRGQGDAPDLTLTGEGWEIEIPTLNAVQGYLLDVRVVRLPLDAPSGAAELRLPDGTVIAQYTIENVPAVYTAPVFEQSPVSAATFAPVGEIVGFDLADAQIGQPLEVTLIWRAQAATPTSYTVFVQVIDAGGRVIAQSDALPAGGARPTTGWRAGEYITDTHSLRWNDQAAPGTARLIAGLYDAATGERLHLADGGDLAVLVTELIVR